MAYSTPPEDLVAAIAGLQDSLGPKMQGIAACALDTPERFIRATSREICAELNTSEPTLIKFCQMFGHTGLSAFRIDLALALAKPGRGGFVEPLTNDRRQVNLAAKRRIARIAADLVAGDDSLLIDNGSTAEIFAMALDTAPPLTIMTTGLLVAQKALEHGRHTVMLTGGRIRPNAMSMAGHMVAASIGTMNFDTFVMSANSVDPERGLSTFQEDEAHNTRHMVDAARRVIVVADRTKIGKPGLHRICEMGRVDTLVTDLSPGAPDIARFEAQGVTILTTDHAQEVRDAVA